MPKSKVTPYKEVDNGEEGREDQPALTPPGEKVHKLKHYREWSLSSIKYFVFLTLFTIAAFGNRPGEVAYYFTEHIRNVLIFEQIPTQKFEKDFYEISKPIDVWEWLEGVFHPVLYPTVDYAGNTVEDDRRAFILLTNIRLLGRVRLRQIRVKKDTCIVPIEMRSIVPDCYETMGGGIVDKSDYVSGGVTYKYEALPGFQSLARLHPYSSGGHYVDLPKSANESLAKIQELRAGEWVDLQTRVLIVEFSLYNANLNLFCVGRLNLEFPSSGGVVPYASLRTLRLIRYTFEGPMDYVVVSCEIALCLLILWYILEEIYEMLKACRGGGGGRHLAAQQVRTWQKYFVDDKWHYLQVANLGIFVAVIVLRLLSHRDMEALLRTEKFRTDDEYVDLQSVAALQQGEEYLNAVNMLFCWIRLFKYMNELPRIGQLVQTLSRAALDIFVFMIIFLVAFLGFVQSGHMMFALDMYEFRTFTSSSIALGRFVVGDFEYEKLELSNRVLGPFFFFSYMILVFFVMTNVFIAIINHAYDGVRDEEENKALKRKRDRRIREFLYNEKPASGLGKVRAAARSMGMVLGSRKKKPTLLDAIQSGDLVFSEDMPWDAADLKKLVQPESVDEMMRDYDLNQDGALTFNEVRAWIDDVEEERRALETAISIMVEDDERRLVTKEKLSPEDVVARARLHDRVHEYHRKVKSRAPANTHGLLNFEYSKPPDSVQGSKATPLTAAVLKTNVGGHIEKPGPREMEVIDTLTALRRRRDSLHSKEGSAGIAKLKAILGRHELSNMHTMAAERVGTLDEFAVSSAPHSVGGGQGGVSSDTGKVVGLLQRVLAQQNRILERMNALEAGGGRTSTAASSPSTAATRPAPDRAAPRHDAHLPAHVEEEEGTPSVSSDESGTERRRIPPNRTPLRW